MAMPRLHTLTQSDGPVTVVRLVGSVDRVTMPATEATLTQALFGDPDALLLDLAEVSHAEARALRTVMLLARRAGLWPGVPVVLYVPDPTLRTMLGGESAEAAVPVCADRGAALALVGRAPTPYRLRVEMQPVPGAARRGRDLATEACLRAGSPELVIPASTVTTELVSNAVRHAGTPFELAFTRTPRYLHIGVHDEDPRPAVRQYPTPDSATGRGLLIVEQTASRWGCSPAQHGKVVWAVLATIR
jgi:anti-anti-sigma regulatory factor